MPDGRLGQELSGTSDVFRQKIEWCFLSISERIASCFEEAKARGDIPATSDPKQMADLLVDCWEGAALRSRLRKDPLSLTNMLDFYIQSWSINERPGKMKSARTTIVRRNAHGPQWTLRLLGPARQKPDPSVSELCWIGTVTGPVQGRWRGWCASQSKPESLRRAPAKGRKTVQGHHHCRCPKARHPRQ